MSIHKLSVIPLIAILLLANFGSSRADSVDFHDADTQLAILSLARRAFDSYASNRSVIDPPSSLPMFFTARYGVFISTMRDGAPRTCMGTLYPCQPNLAEEIIQNSVASAGRDRRFKAVEVSELPHLDLIVSIILGPPKPISISEAQEVDPAKNGIAALCGDRYGVVLSGETFSAATMIKWAKIRAFAANGVAVRLFKITDVRFMESQFK